MVLSFALIWENDPGLKPSASMVIAPRFIALPEVAE